MNTTDYPVHYTNQAESENLNVLEHIDEELISERLEPLNTANEKLLLLYLIVVPEAEPEAIKQTVDMNLLTILPLLSRLHERGLIERDESGCYTCDL